MPILFKNVNYQYPDSANGVFDINLEINEGEFLAVIGPSGSGKSTLLKMLSGFAVPTSGSVILDGKDITRMPPEKRELGIVFQSYGLFPHMSALDNVAYPLKIRGLAKTQRRAMALEALDRVSLKKWATSMPLSLSGGQQQRVALARALVFSPKALLLDEPLSALDAALRVEMRDEILRVQRNANIATLHVTHDQEEALSIADRIAIMQAGKIIQLGTPKELYDKPANRWVASFIGQANLWNGKTGAQENHVETPAGILRCDTGNYSPGTPVTVMIRPESVVPGIKPGQPVSNILQGHIHADRFLGSTRRIDLKIKEALLRMDTLSREPFEQVTIPAEAIKLLPAE
ncbi:ABC transporter ATP-binding protein [Advenella alkanexedens]|uniref:ABC transporter ATP-binding protein n=1 Tax=Advenella alkanexedens TaxID=1481665 RepID=UPI0026755931|nr:ABC transporter ATP-binding protein [Advenella alkanexedens]WKU19871.1 ABC transporter ATP-binding protein [Advenella alkanexedens]